MDLDGVELAALSHGHYPRFVGIHREIWEGFRDRFVPVDGLYPLCPGAWLAPETVRGGPFASREPNLLRKVGEDRFLPDDFSHEQSMVLETGRGLVVLNSCCHGGVVNIVKGVLDQFPGQRVYALLGGLHMLSPGANALNCPPDYVRQVAAALHWSCRLCTAEGGAGGPGGAPHRRNAAGYLRSGISSMFGRTH